MKTYRIEVQRLKAITHTPGLIELQIDAQVLPNAAKDEFAEASRLALSEENARVLHALLRQQLAEIDKRKGRSQR